MASAPFSFSLDVKGFKAEMKGIDQASVRATKYALRATGRELGRVARSAAPKYPGRLNADSGIDQRAINSAGNLKKSIKNSRSIKQVGDSYEMKVGPFASGGNRTVRSYRKMVEQMYHFMIIGTRAVGRARTQKIFSDAYDQAFKKARR
jgi:hypothetical protein